MLTLEIGTVDIKDSCMEIMPLELQNFVSKTLFEVESHTVYIRALSQLYFLNTLFVVLLNVFKYYSIG